MTVSSRGDRELALRFDTFPARAHARLAERVTALIETLEARVEAAAPQLTGRLRSEVHSRVYTDKPSRIAGYVEIYAPAIPGEYAKAATLEYGTDKPRRVFQRTSGVMSRLSHPRRRIVERATAAVHIEAVRYLRGPFADLKDEANAQLNAALAASAQE